MVQAEGGEAGRLVAVGEHRNSSFYWQGHHVFSYAVLAGNVEDGWIYTADEGAHSRFSHGQRREDEQEQGNVRHGGDVPQISRSGMATVLLREQTGSAIR